MHHIDSVSVEITEAVLHVAVYAPVDYFIKDEKTAYAPVWSANFVYSGGLPEGVSILDTSEEYYNRTPLPVCWMSLTQLITLLKEYSIPCTT